ncbi:MAG: methyltransferase family protein [Solirubrobacteraceae bacterium]
MGAAIALLIVKVLPASAWSWGKVHSWEARAPGLVLLLICTAFALWARVTLGTMWSSTALVREHHRLRTSGPYAVTRHPIYTGLLGMMLGTALANGLPQLVPGLHLHARPRHTG